MIPSGGSAVIPPHHAAPDIPSLRDMIRGLAGFPTLASLKASPFWEERGQEILGLLRRLQSGSPRHPSPEGGARDRMRIVHWNIERGKNLDAVLHNLKEHPDLRGADLVLLNEVDVGMARSGNRHTARELAEGLGLHWVFSPSYLELTKGLREEMQAPGENRESLHGLAVLSRDEPVRVERVELPEIFDTFDFVEKRFGARTALVVHLGAARGDLVIASTHLEVRDTPTGRRLQLQGLLKDLDAHLEDWGIAEAPVLLAGDLNTHTFSRGSVVRNARAVGRILATPLDRLAEELTEPWRGGREPLFQALRAAGFRYEELNDRSPTVSLLLRGVEEAENLPLFLRRWIGRAAAIGERVLPMRLDWFAARGFPASPEAHRPAVTRTATVLPHAVHGRIPSDHLPLLLELRWPGD